MTKVCLLILMTLLMSCGRLKGEPGAVGASGANGLDGQDGATGSTGPSGPQGPAGADGTVVYAVQFCQGYTPSYPSTFPEVGVCINSKLYGVYSAPNNVGMVELPPGHYATTMTNAPCTFNIGANCSVTP